ncbi:hypothetical protein LOTGIDRAFT_133365, partial [Lottia gigantea]
IQQFNQSNVNVLASSQLLLFNNSTNQISMSWEAVSSYYSTIQPIKCQCPWKQSAPIIQQFNQSNINALASSQLLLFNNSTNQMSMSLEAVSSYYSTIQPIKYQCPGKQSAPIIQQFNQSNVNVLGSSQLLLFNNSTNQISMSWEAVSSYYSTIQPIKCQCPGKQSAPIIQQFNQSNVNVLGSSQLLLFNNSTNQMSMSWDTVSSNNLTIQPIKCQCPGIQSAPII